MNMKAMHIFRGFRPGVCSRVLWLGLCFVSLPGQALTLGDLAVSSSTSPSFTASLPFSDDKLIRLSYLQTRIATDAEYAQWGLQIPQVVRELRVRVAPASQAVGYVELYSVAPLSQTNFDLLMWAAYSGQTMLRHYKVSLQDMPSLIKGTTLSSSQALSSTWATGQTGIRQAHRKPDPSALPKAALTPTDTERMAEQDASTMSNQAQEVSVVAPPHPSLTNSVNGKPHSIQTTRTSGSDPLGIGSLLLLFSVILFLFGFLLGRQRNSGETVLTHKTSEIRKNKGWRTQDSLKAHQPTKPQVVDKGTPVRHAPQPQQDARPFQTIMSRPLAVATPAAAFTMPLSQAMTLHEAPQSRLTQPCMTETTPSLMESTALATTTKLSEEPMTSDPSLLNTAPGKSEASETMQITTPPPDNNIASCLPVVSRPMATALPTPGRARVSGALTKSKQTKSAGNTNIDLAKVYLSMGDPSTAQMVLQQVIEQGSEEEKVLAEQLMQEMV